MCIKNICRASCWPHITFVHIQLPTSSKKQSKTLTQAGKKPWNIWSLGNLTWIPLWHVKFRVRATKCFFSVCKWSVTKCGLHVINGIIIIISIIVIISSNINISHSNSVTSHYKWQRACAGSKCIMLPHYSWPVQLICLIITPSCSQKGSRYVRVSAKVYL